jgi:hypothetical protein
MLFRRCLLVVLLIAPLVFLEGVSRGGADSASHRVAGVPLTVVGSVALFFMLVALTAVYSGRQTTDGD